MIISKYTILLLIFISTGLISYSQKKFVEGYVIFNNNEKIDCLIRNIGNNKSADNFQYKITDDEEIKDIEISKIKQFGIGKTIECTRAIIEIDFSPNRINELKDTLSQFVKGHAYLKILVEGELASLYSYFHQGKLLFYYSVSNSKIEPLIHKTYYMRLSSSLIQNTLYDNTYQEQLKQYLLCERNPVNFKKIPYSKKALVKHFIDYHKCQEADYKVFESAHVNKGSFRLKLGLNYNSMQFSIKDFSDALPNILFSKEKSLGVGIETEYLLPINNYQWSLFAESNYYSYYSDSVINAKNVTLLSQKNINYKTIEFPFGITRYINFNENHSLFVRGAFVPHFVHSGSYIAFNEQYHSNLVSSSRFLVGAGYHYQKVGLEFRYYSPINTTKHIYKRGSKFSQISFRIYYTLFKTGN